MFKLEMYTDNAAFTSDPAYEVRRILWGIDEQLERGVTGGRLMDSNGNTVGKWSLSEE